MSTAAAPPVTLGVPVWNGEAYLSAALTSLQEQEFTDFEVIIADNASSDGTEEICRSFAADDPRFVYHRNAENIGGVRNSMLLLDLARSPYFRWVYYDDINPPALVGGLHDAIVAGGPDTVASFPRVILINEEGVRIGAHHDADLDLTDDRPHRRLAVLLSRVVGQVQYGLMRTDVARATGGIPMEIAGEMVMPAALALRGKLALLDGPPLSIRVHEKRSGGDRDSEAAWVDPDRPRVIFPYSRSSMLLINVVRAAGLDPAEERRCIQAVLWNWTRASWKTIIGDVVRLPHDLRLFR